MKRRLAAWAALALLLNLSFIGVQRACVAPADAMPPASSMDHGSHGGHHMPPPAHHAPARCCDAVSSCGPALSLGVEAGPVQPVLQSRVVTLLMCHSPASPSRAPEPPPPKA